MYVDRIFLKNIRNLENINLKLENNINIFYGNNAQGKTNLLESIYFCAMGRSQRNCFDKELIKFDTEDGIIQTFIKNESFVDKISIYLRKNFRKGITINGIPIKKLGELFGILLVVIFSPEDLQLVKSGPSERRKFIDVELCQLNSIYYYNLQQYYKILKQRNNLLKKIQKDSNLKNTIFIWDEQLLEYGCKIMDIRFSFIEKLNTISKEIHSNLTNNLENLDLIYKPNVSKDKFLEKLKKNLDKDIIYGNTSNGIQKDDILIFINNKDVKNYGSQGQQRTVCLSMKLAEIKLIEEQKREKPVLLLDDVLSELDLNRQTFLLNYIQNIQTILTCTGEEDILDRIYSKMNTSIFNVNAGKVQKN